MLEELKQSYKESADMIPGWKKISRSALCNLYLEVKDKDSFLCQSYLSAIIYKFWNLVEKNYYKQWKEIASIEECYDWLVDSVLQVLDQHVWTDPDNKLYGDKNAPEKCINVCLNSRKINYFVAQQRQKRVSRLKCSSLDWLEEDSSDGYWVPYYDKYDSDHELLDSLIKDYFLKKDYFKSFCLFVIIHFESFKREEYNDQYYKVFDAYNVKKDLRYLSTKDIQIFSQTYGFSFDECKDAYEYIKNLSYDKMTRNLDNFLFELSKNKKLIKDLRA